MYANRPLNRRAARGRRAPGANQAYASAQNHAALPISVALGVTTLVTESAPRAAADDRLTLPAEPARLDLPPLASRLTATAGVAEADTSTAGAIGATGAVASVVRPAQPSRLPRRPWVKLALAAAIFVTGVLGGVFSNRASPTEHMLLPVPADITSPQTSR